MTLMRPLYIIFVRACKESASAGTLCARVTAGIKKKKRFLSQPLFLTPTRLCRFSKCKYLSNPQFLHEFWELLSYIANTCIFTLTGVIITSHKFQDIDLSDFACSIAIYVTIMVARLGIFTGINKIMSARGFDGVPTKAETYICCWGSLRGAVGLALALVVWDNDQSVYSDKILFHAAMIVMFTLTCNATTVAKLLRHLGLDQVDELKDKLFHVSMDEIKTAGFREIESLKMDELISCASWPEVRQLGSLKLPMRKRPKRDSSNKALEKQSSAFCKELLFKRELRESRRRCLAAVKASYRNQFRNGLLSRKALVFLEILTEKMIDNDCKMEEWKHICQTHLFSKSKRSLSTSDNPVMQWFFSRLNFQRLRFGYDVVCGFYHARSDALHAIDTILGSSNAAYKHISQIINSDQEIAKKTILDVQRFMPEVAANIATLRAVRSMLNAQRSATNELFENGFLDKLEHGRVVQTIEVRMHELQHSPPSIDMPSKFEMIKEISWLSAAPHELVKFVSDLAVEHVVDEGDVIIKQGELSNNMFLIARGTATVTMKREDGTEEVLTEIGVGTLIGELSWLTNLPRAATVTSASRGLIYSLSGKKMNNLMDEEHTVTSPSGSYAYDGKEKKTFGSMGTKSFGNTLSRNLTKRSFVGKDQKEETLKKNKKSKNTIRKKIWQNAGFRLAENLLRYEEPYNVWDKADLRRWLVQWILYIPQATNIEVVKACILVDGTAQLPWMETTGEVYAAPYYLKPYGSTPMKLRISNCKILCPPGAIRDVNQEVVNRKSSVDQNIFRAGGWKLVKQKLVDEKKHGWGKLAVDIQGAIRKEKEAREVADCKAGNRRSSASVIRDDIHEVVYASAYKSIDGSASSSSSSSSRGDKGSEGGGEEEDGGAWWGTSTFARASPASGKVTPCIEGDEEEEEEEEEEDEQGNEEEEEEEEKKEEEEEQIETFDWKEFRSKH